MMHAPNPQPLAKSGRKVTATTIMAAILALVALGAMGLFVQERMRMDAEWERARERADTAKTNLDSVHFDKSGNVSPEERATYDRAMRDISNATASLRTFNEAKGRTVPYIGGAALACVAFLIVAIRSTKQA